MPASPNVSWLPWSPALHLPSLPIFDSCFLKMTENFPVGAVSVGVVCLKKENMAHPGSLGFQLLCVSCEGSGFSWLPSLTAVLASVITGGFTPPIYPNFPAHLLSGYSRARTPGPDKGRVKQEEFFPTEIRQHCSFSVWRFQNSGQRFSNYGAPR